MHRDNSASIPPPSTDRERGGRGRGLFFRRGPRSERPSAARTAAIAPWRWLRCPDGFLSLDIHGIIKKRGKVEREKKVNHEIGI